MTKEEEVPITGSGSGPWDGGSTLNGDRFNDRLADKGCNGRGA